VVLTASTNSGVIVTKTLTFHKGSYLIDVAYKVDNHSATSLTSSAYFPA